MTLLEAFNIILTANEEESRKTARQVRKLAYSHNDKDKYSTIVSIIETAPQTYTDITEEFRQENFVKAISVLYFLRNDS